MSRININQLIEEEIQSLNEGVYDPGILKVFFLCGGPGSGKGFVIKNIFGTAGPDGKPISKTVTPYGLKILNSDTAFEYLLSKHNVNMKTLDKLSQAEFEKYTIGDDSERSKAKKITAQLMQFYTDGRLGVIVDGTGGNMEKVVRLNKQFQELGYDTYVLFVNTSLDVAQARNKARDRVLPEKLVEDEWIKSKANRDAYKALFKSNFYEVDNSEYKMPDKQISNNILKLIRQPVKNPIGKQWIENEIAHRNRIKKMI